MKDQYLRTIDYCRISVTANCNFACSYCINSFEAFTPDQMSMEDYEIIFSTLLQRGIYKFKFTGGEPLVRKDFFAIVKLLRNIAENFHIKIEISLTTNGYLINNYLDEITNLIDQVTISLDTIDEKRYAEISRIDGLQQVLSNIQKLKSANFTKIKINTVIGSNFNHQDIINLINYANEYHLVIRFIELMPFGQNKISSGISEKIISLLIHNNYTKSYSLYHKKLGNGPAQYIQLDNKQIIGFIQPNSNKFCHKCNKIRITSDFKIKGCLAFQGQSFTSANFEQIFEMITKNKPLEHTFNTSLDEKNTMKNVGG